MKFNSSRVVPNHLAKCPTLKKFEHFKKKFKKKAGRLKLNFKSYLCRKLNVWQLVFPLVFLKHSSAHPRTVVADIEFRYVKCLYPVRIRSKHSIKIEILY